MELKYSFFADATSIDVNSKVNALGIFDTIHCQQFPATHPRFAYVVKVGYHRAEIGAHKVKLTLLDQDGNMVCDEYEVEVNVDARGLGSTHTVDYSMVTFPSPGPYELAVSVDGRHVGSTTLNLVKL